jgi:aspartyl-tRNA(Asn)/glutamyl-tRNA(Gln) amidotransferase subunit B
LSLQESGIDITLERHQLPELPAAKRHRFASTHGISDYDASVLSGTRALADYYEQVVAAATDPKAAANWIMGSVLADANEHAGRFRVIPSRLAELVKLVGQGTLSLQAAKKVFAEIAERDASPAAVAERLGLTQVGDTDLLGAWIEAVLSAYPNEVRRYRQGESRLLGFFMGAVMKESRGRADPNRVQPALRARLGS